MSKETKVKKTQSNGELAGVSKRYLVMYEDGHYYGSFSPLSIWETYEGAEIAENNWKQKNPNKQTVVEEVDYNAC